MKSSKLLTLLSAMAFSATASAVTTDAVGFVSVTVPANSDAVLAVPLNRAAEFKGVIQSIAGNVITVAGTPAWGNNIFAPGVTANKTYAVQIAGGAKEGLVGTITLNGSSSITVTLDAGENLTGIGTVAVPVDPDGAGPLAAQADQIDIMPFWTPAALFSTVPPAIFELSGFAAPNAGINLGASEIYAHAGSNAWEDGINGGDATNSPLRFGTALIARNGTGAAYTFSMVGAVPMTAQRIRLATLANNQAQDVAIGYMSPVPESLSTVGDPAVPDLQESANALGFPVQAGDSIQGFDNSSIGINKGAATIYAWNGTAWEDDINGGVINYTVKLQPGFGYIFRKAATPTPSVAVWTHLQSYLQ